jgi:hypothetical protein
MIYLLNIEETYFGENDEILFQKAFREESVADVRLSFLKEILTKTILDFDKIYIKYFGFQKKKKLIEGLFHNKKLTQEQRQNLYAKFQKEKQQNIDSFINKIKEQGIILYEAIGDLKHIIIFITEIELEE